ncbi:MAG: M67 family metallopeptidase [Nitrospirota bacterium]
MTKKIFNEILLHCKEAYPQEACGILAGMNGVVERIYRVTNTEKSGVNYVMDSREQFEVMKEIRQRRLEITAIYHSHPYSDASPSQKDIMLAFYPDSFYVIVSLIYEEPAVKAYEIRDRIVREIEIVCT